MQGDVGAGGGVGGGGEIVGVGFTLHLEHRHGDLNRQLGFGGEPFGCRPAVHHLPGPGVGGGQLQHVVVGVVDEQGAAQAAGGLGGDAGIGAGQQGNQGGDVVAADHRGQQPHRCDRAQQGAGGAALGDRAQPGGLDVGGLIHPRRDPLAQQLQQEGLFAGGGLLQQFGEGLGLGCRQGQGRHPQGCALGRGGAIGGQQLGGDEGGGHSFGLSAWQWSHFPLWSAPALVAMATGWRRAGAEGPGAAGAPTSAPARGNPFPASASGQTDSAPPC